MFMLYIHLGRRSSATRRARLLSFRRQLNVKLKELRLHITYIHEPVSRSVSMYQCGYTHRNLLHLHAYPLIYISRMSGGREGGRREEREGGGEEREGGGEEWEGGGHIPINLQS